MDTASLLIRSEDCKVVYEPTGIEVLEYFYNECVKYNSKYKTYQAKRLKMIIEKLGKGEKIDGN